MSDHKERARQAYADARAAGASVVEAQRTYDRQYSRSATPPTFPDPNRDVWLPENFPEFWRRVGGKWTWAAGGES